MVPQGTIMGLRYTLSVSLVGVLENITGSHNRVGTLFVPKTFGMHTFFYSSYTWDFSTKILYFFIFGFRYVNVYSKNSVQQ